MARKKKFKFARRRKTAVIAPYIPRTYDDDEQLTGFVRGFNASDIEERFARALIKAELGFWFQYKVETIHTLPGQEKRVDFIVFYMPGRIQPVEIYGERWHESQGDKQRDIQREAEINEAGRVFGWDLLKVVWGKELQDQRSADHVVRRLFV